MTPLNESKPNSGDAPDQPQAAGRTACDAATSAFDPWLSRLYFETLMQLSRQTLH
ncbi:MAG: hypothetical protein VCC02_09850 [Myxococcota bacterium]|jgi:hypothetical protein